MYYPEESKKFKETLTHFKGKQVVVLTHLRPDGDALGSQVALCRVLNDMGAKATGVYVDEAPDNLEFLIEDTPLLSLNNFKAEGDVMAITVDCADAIRPGKEIAATFPKIALNIDHHISNENYGECNIVDSKAASTTEILSQLLIDSEIAIDATTAQALYAGIVTDTGRFKYPTTSKRLFEVCAKLVEYGANPGRVSYHIYENEPLARVLLLQEFLASLKYELNGEVCVGFITKAMLEKTGAKREHTEDFVNHTRSIKGVKIGALIEELGDGKLKGSLRANDSNLRVDLLAKSFKSGGGHAAAAGFRDEGTVEEFFHNKFMKTVEGHLKEYNK